MTDLITKLTALGQTCKLLTKEDYETLDKATDALVEALDECDTEEAIRLARLLTNAMGSDFFFYAWKSVDFYRNYD